MQRTIFLVVHLTILAGGVYFLIVFFERDGSLVAGAAGILLIAYSAYQLVLDLLPASTPGE
jgi:hypothetical protein